MAEEAPAESCGNLFNDDDLAKLLHEDQTTSKEEGWNLLSKNDQCEVWRKDDPSKPVKLVKGFLKFKNIPPPAILDIFYDLESRTKWDKQFPVIEVLESNEHCRTVYWLSKLPLGVTDRDLVQNVCTRRDEETNTTYVMSYHATHPSKPEVSNVIRAETILSGSIIRPYTDDPNSTRVTLLIQVDMKGWIPHTIVNTFGSKSPQTWHSNVTNYYWNDYSKKKGAAGEEGVKDDGGASA